MARIVEPDGRDRHPRLFICGERPGIEEYRSGRGFVGPAGAELWARLKRVCGITRDVCWVTNLVKTFSTAPPTDREIARAAPMLRDELRTIRPAIIVTVGYHAARWFLPQFRGINGDFFHGLPYSTPRCRGSYVIPIVHSAAALRQPERYQDQLTHDLRAVRDALQSRARPQHHSAVPYVHAVGLATALSYTGRPLAIDSEGRDPRHTECLTLTNDPDVRSAVCVETHQRGRRTLALPHVATLIRQSSSIVSHHAKVEMQALHALRVPFDERTVDCTMLQAYLLGLPQSLKVLAYRLCGYEMRAFEDLVAPLDDRVVRSTLEAVYATWHHAFFQSSEAWQAAQTEYRDARNAARQAAGDPRARQRFEARAKAIRQAAGRKPKVPPTIVDQRGTVVARRALGSVRRILDSEADTTRRQRWQGSTFAPLIDLPPEPTWKAVPHAERTAYALTDAAAHLAVHQRMQPMIDQAGLRRIYNIDRSILPFLCRNEEVGLKVDGDQLAALDQRFAREYADVLVKLERLAGHPVNPLAAEEVSDVVFDEWDVLPTRRNKSGWYTTEDKYLKARKDDHEGIPLIIDGRQINKMRSTYVRRLPGLLRRGRYHPNWKYTRTASGRAAEEIILLIPKHSERGQAIRRAFVADDDCLLVSCDLSQIEMRVMAHESRDPTFLYNYEHGIDMHANTAYTLLGAPKHKDQQDESLHRLPAKTLNFGVLMGMTEYGLCDQLQERGLKWVVELDPLDKADRELRRQGFKSTREFLREWFKVYPGVAAWVQERKAEARRTGYVRDLYDRRIAVSGIWSTDDRIANEYERKAHAIPIQSGAQGTAKKWIARIWQYTIAPRLRDARQYCEPWVWIHDDVTLCVAIPHAAAVAREMLNMVPQDLCVPVSADAKAGFNWASYDKKRPKANPDGLGSFTLDSRA